MTDGFDVTNFFSGLAGAGIAALASFFIDYRNRRDARAAELKAARLKLLSETATLSGLLLDVDEHVEDMPKNVVLQLLATREALDRMRRKTWSKNEKALYKALDARIITMGCYTANGPISILRSSISSLIYDRLNGKRFDRATVPEWPTMSWLPHFEIADEKGQRPFPVTSGATRGIAATAVDPEGG